MKNLFGDDKGMTGLTKAQKQQKRSGNTRTAEAPSSAHTQNWERTRAPRGRGLQPGGFYTQKATANVPPSHPIIAILTATTVTPKPLRFNMCYSTQLNQSHYLT